VKKARRHNGLARGILRDCCGGPLAELALVLPFLLLLIFGGYEAGRFIYIQNIITKSVQDGARYAARHPAVIENGSCVPSSAEWGVVQTNTETIVRRGSILAPALLHPDLDPANATVSVFVSCVPPTGTMQTSNPGAGVNVPIVVVNVTVPVTDFGFMGFLGLSSFTLTAEHREMAVGL
jgi:hypothetical protein